MQLETPTSLTDVATDGFIAQHASTWEHALAFGPNPQVDFARTGGGYTVTFNGTHTFAASTVGTINGTQFTWAVPTPFDIPELKGTVTLSDELIAAARTLRGNGPAFIVPEGNDLYSLAVVDRPVHNISPRDAIKIALAHARLHQVDVDKKRALVSFAAFADLGLRENEGLLFFSDGTTVDPDAGVVQNADEHTFGTLVSDAELFSVESQLFFEGRFPDAIVTMEGENRAHIRCDATQTYLSAHAVPIATITDQHFNWIHSPATAPIFDWARRHTIPELIEKDIPVETARQRGFAVAAKPLLRKWTHAFVPNPDGFTIVLLDAPELRLPAPSAAGCAATIIRARDSINPRRALDSYAAIRGIHIRMPEDLRSDATEVIVPGEHTFSVVWQEKDEVANYLFSPTMSKAYGLKAGQFALV